MTKPSRSHLLRRLTLSTAFALAALCSTAAFAGEVKVGATPLELDDKGKLTAKGKDAVVEELDEVPGEDVWIAHIYARLDNPGEGPLYVEFYQELDGNKSLVWRHDENNFAADKFVNLELELDGRKGFNKNRTYEIKFTQVSPKGKDLVLASGKIKLIKSGKKPPKEEGDEGEEGGKEDPDQDAHDSLGGGDKGDGGEGGDKGGEGGGEGPPPVEKKKGCSVDAEGSGWSGAMVLMALGAGLILRRRR